MNEFRRRLLWHGMFLFLLGLMTGLLETQFANIRMGLAAHLEGVLNGIFLLALGSVWTEVRHSRSLAGLTFGAALYGAYANWCFTTLAAVFGTGALSPVTAPGLKAAPWQETLITAGFMSVGVAMIAAAALVLWGLRKAA